MKHSLEALFAAQGALASAVSGYRVREGQLTLAQTINDALLKQRVLIAEAGTGTGKTFAYLLPALAHGEKVLVSTATKNLQEQIYTQDLPLVRQVLQSGARVALLKGRRNYFCHYHYAKLLDKPATGAADKHYRAAIARFVKKTKDGDLSTLDNVPEDAPVLSEITSSADNCLGRDCDYYEECFLQQARQKAKEADVIVVNHHLLLADFALRSEGFAEILPDVRAFIIDEAHHLPQTAVNFLGTRLSSRQILQLISDIKVAQLQEAPDALKVANLLPQANKALQDTVLTLKSTTDERIDAEELDALDTFWRALVQTQSAFSTLTQALQQHAERGKLLANVQERCATLLTTIEHFLPQTYRGKQSNDTPAEATPTPEATTQTQARWLDCHPRGFVLSSVPVDGAMRFANWIKQSEASWTFLSATMAIDGKFDHFARQLGLQDYEQLLMDSPFNYRQQAVLYHPKNLPDPRQKDYTSHLIASVLPILQESGGRAFLLFTSYRALREAEQCLQGVDFNLFVQGSAPKAQLLKDFRQAKRAVLLATSSFWEGVDVRGDALVCVVIDKLPFAAPNDPITKTRHRLLSEKGLSAFMYDSLPQAVITLKQGVGRLIRGEKDYGVLVIGDPRLTQKGYGKVFVDSLPAMTKTTKLSVVKRFFAFHEGAKP